MTINWLTYSIFKGIMDTMESPTEPMENYTLDLSTQIEVTESVLAIVETALSRQDTDTINNLGGVVAPLIDYMSDGEISFIDLNEYLGYIQDSYRRGDNPRNDAEINRWKGVLRDQLRKAKELGNSVEE